MKNVYTRATPNRLPTVYVNKAYTNSSTIY
jgi:hypothetical protein